MLIDKKSYLRGVCRCEFLKGTPRGLERLVNLGGNISTNSSDVVLQLEVKTFAAGVVRHQHGTWLKAI